MLLAIDFLVMIVIGGVGSVGGTAAGALFGTALPVVLKRYSDALPLLADPGSGGIAAPASRRFGYGGAIVLLLLFEPEVSPPWSVAPSSRSRAPAGPRAAPAGHSQAPDVRRPSPEPGPHPSTRTHRMKGRSCAAWP